MNALNAKWGELRGLKFVSVAIGSVTLPDEDAEMIKQAQRTAIMRDPTMAAATLAGAQADAMKTAAGNHCRSHDRIYGYGNGEFGRRNKCRRFICNGTAAGGAGSFSGAAEYGRMAVFMRRYGKREFLLGMRRGKACIRRVEMFMRNC